MGVPCPAPRSRPLRFSAGATTCSAAGPTGFPRVVSNSSGSPDPMSDLKLVALDGDDLAILSAHVQDAVLKMADLRWLGSEKRFVLAMNRLARERARKGAKEFERRRAALHFDRVEKVSVTGLRQEAKEAVLVLLAIRFEETEAPAGRILLDFAGGGKIRLDVECIEAQLADLGAAWATRSLPQHDLDEA